MSTPAQSLASLLNDLADFIRRYIALSQAKADICAAWVVHTHTIEVAQFTPYLNITSALPQSGKTNLLELLSMLVGKPWLTGRVTAGSLVRKTDKEQPTLLLDESDAAFQADREYAEALRGLLNSGFSRTGTSSMCVQAGQSWDTRDFRTFCPKAIAGIGNLPDTVRDRSVLIKLKRKLPTERCERFRHRKVRPLAEALKKRTAEWATQNLEILRNAEPEMPEELDDRHQDTCEPLVALADCAGGEWPQRLRRALVDVCKGGAQHERADKAILLTDIRSIFERQNTDRISTQNLLNELTRMEASPWAEYDKGKAITSFRLAQLLSPLDIHPRDIRFERGTLKGYNRADFEDAWARYLPGSPPCEAAGGQQGRQSAIDACSDALGRGQRTPVVAGPENAKTPAITRPVADVAPAAYEMGPLPDCYQKCIKHGVTEHRLRPDQRWECVMCHK